VCFSVLAQGSETKRVFVIRKFRPEDLDAVWHVNAVSLPEHYPPSFYLAIHEANPDLFLVSCVGEKIVGYAMGRVERTPLWTALFGGAKKRGHVISIAVLSEWRRRGIGSALMVELLKGFKRVGCEEAFLEVRVSNKPAIRLYEKLGFRRVDILRGYYKDGEDAYLMTLDLSAWTPPNGT
jgi:ribosomal-protein-alanine N-acetyltransferase